MQHFHVSFKRSSRWDSSLQLEETFLISSLQGIFQRIFLIKNRSRMIKIILIKAKWNAFVQNRMNCEAPTADTEDSELSTSFSHHSEYLSQ